MEKAIVSLKGLDVAYGDNIVLSGINLQIKCGEFIAIVGPSGCGKTTLLNTLAGFLPKTGEVLVPQRKAYVFQQYTLFPWMSVGENIVFGMKGLEKQQQDKIISECLALTDLDGFASRLPNELSGGQQQRIAVARALVRKSELLLMDEPFASLDNKMRSKMQEWLLNTISKTKTTVVFVTHNIEEAVFLADRVIVLGPNSSVREIKIPFSRPRKEILKYTRAFNVLKRKIDAFV